MATRPRRRTRSNPGILTVFGNPSARARKRNPISEHANLEEALIDLMTATRRIREGSPNVAILLIDKAAARVRELLVQVQRGIHMNPRGSARGERMSGHVQAIAYVHAQDGDQYVHGFGDAELNAKELQKGILDLSDLHDQTDIEMFAMPDGSLSLRSSQGKDLTALFD